MRKFEKTTFDYFEDRSTGRVFSDIEFTRCQFSRVGFSTITPSHGASVDLVGLRSTARHIKFINCKVDGVSFVGPGIVEDCVIDGLKVNRHLQTKGTAFKHVIIRGVVDKLMITPIVDLSGGYPEVQRQFDCANEEYYKEVDWALDISEGIFKDCDIRGVSASLIRRDPETQFVLSREQAMRGGWRNINLSGTHWATAIGLFLERGFSDCVLVAPKGAPNFLSLLTALKDLRDAGIVV